MTSLEKLPTQDASRQQEIFAGLSSFGYSGTIAHVVLQNATSNGFSGKRKTGLYFFAPFRIRRQEITKHLFDSVELDNPFTHKSCTLLLSKLSPALLSDNSGASTLWMSLELSLQAALRFMSLQRSQMSGIALSALEFHPRNFDISYPSSKQIRCWEIKPSCLQIDLVTAGLKQKACIFKSSYSLGGINFGQLAFPLQSYTEELILNQTDESFVVNRQIVNFLHASIVDFLCRSVPSMNSSQEVTIKAVKYLFVSFDQSNLANGALFVNITAFKQHHVHAAKLNLNVISATTGQVMLCAEGLCVEFFVLESMHQFQLLEESWRVSIPIIKQNAYSELTITANCRRTKDLLAEIMGSQDIILLQEALADKSKNHVAVLLYYSVSGDQMKDMLFEAEMASRKAKQAIVIVVQAENESIHDKAALEALSNIYKSLNLEAQLTSLQVVTTPELLRDASYLSNLLQVSCKAMWPAEIKKSLRKTFRKHNSIAASHKVIKMTHGQNGSNWIITGGLGGLGLLTAKVLVKLGARHLFLVSRSGKIAYEGQ
ncbi:KR domain-containing protein, partial [archaeon]